MSSTKLTKFYLSVGCLLVGYVAFCLWRHGSEDWSDFGLNLFTEVLGVGATVLIIERALRKSKEREDQPFRYAAYQDIARLVTAHVTFWHAAYTEGVPKPDPPTIARFLSTPTFQRIWIHLDCSALVPKHSPSSDWYAHLSRSMHHLTNEGNQLLTRHTKHLPAHIYAGLHSIVSQSIGPLLTNLRQITDILQGMAPGAPRISNINNHCPLPTQAYLDILLHLYEWCHSEYDEIKKQVPITEPPYRYAPGNDHPNPPCTLAASTANLVWLGTLAGDEQARGVFPSAAYKAKLLNLGQLNAAGEYL